MTYTLLDSGNQSKLEKFGDYVLAPPCSLVVWKPLFCIAGPGGGTKEKPVGTVLYALGQRGQDPDIGILHLKGNRQTFILRTSTRLFALLLKKILRS